MTKVSGIFMNRKMGSWQGRTLRRVVKWLDFGLKSLYIGIFIFLLTSMLTGGVTPVKVVGALACFCMLIQD